jgi:FdhD protein
MKKLVKKVELTLLRDHPEVIQENVIKESFLKVSVKGADSFEINTYLGKQEKELVVGHLFARGLIRHANDIKSLTINSGQAQVILQTKPERSPTIKKTTSALAVNREDIFNCVQAVLSSPIFAETEGVHCAGLFRHGKEPICIAEDIGRHHAVDKVIGSALLKQITFGECVLGCTGRMAGEMVIKACRAGIPMIATKAAVTDHGIELAEKYGIALIGFVRQAGGKMNTDMSTRTFKTSIMKIFSHPERILC